MVLKTATNLLTGNVFSDVLNLGKKEPKDEPVTVPDIHIQEPGKDEIVGRERQPQRVEKNPDGSFTVTVGGQSKVLSKEKFADLQQKQRIRAEFGTQGVETERREAARPGIVQDILNMTASYEVGNPIRARLEKYAEDIASIQESAQPMGFEEAESLVPGGLDLGATTSGTIAGAKGAIGTAALVGGGVGAIAGGALGGPAAPITAPVGAKVGAVIGAGIAGGLSLAGSYLSSVAQNKAEAVST